MNPRPIHHSDMDTWAHRNQRPVTFSAPAEREAGIPPCEALITAADQFGPVIRVPWTLDEIELNHLANGGTIWLSCWNHLPVHLLQVIPPGGRPES
jgi:hypothetical protein